MLYEDINTFTMLYEDINTYIMLYEDINTFIRGDEVRYKKIHNGR